MSDCRYAIVMNDLLSSTNDILKLFVVNGQ